MNPAPLRAPGERRLSCWWCEFAHPPFRRVLAVHKVSDGALCVCLCLRCGRNREKLFDRDEGATRAADREGRG